MQGAHAAEACAGTSSWNIGFSSIMQRMNLMCLSDPYSVENQMPSATHLWILVCSVWQQPLQ